jgi:lipoprotein-anchoring transpeptidase ErfK/SrfK
MRGMANVLLLGGILLLACTNAGVAQSLPPWAEELFGRRFDYDYGRRREAPERQMPPRREARDAEGDVRSGGARPVIAAVTPPIVAFPHAFTANSIVIDTGERKLYYVLAGQRAYEYRIGVGREGFNWAGTEAISRKQAWPDWHPPAEMRERDPSLPEKMTGGIKNPLGAMALYLGSTLYRIHGTNDPKSIGRAESSGCFRMLNSAVLHLASVTEIGTPVAVVTSLPKQPEAGRVSEVATPPPPAEAKPPALPAVNAPPPPPQPAQNYQSLRDYTLQTR